jgi:signal transduction histidine kinase
MNSTAIRRLNLGLSNDVILTVLVVLGFVSVFTVPAGALALGDYVILAGANLIYLLNGIYGWRRWDRTRAPVTGLVYFAGQYALSTFIVYWSYQNIWLLLLPLASQSIELRRRWTVVVCLMLMVSFSLPMLLPARLLAGGLIQQPEDLTLATVFEAMFDFGMALVFILLFSELVVRERLARAKLDEAHRRLSEYAVQVEDLATLEERNRLAREIHDNLGHYLTVINVHLEAARTLLDNQPALALDATFASLSTSLDRAQSLTREGLAEVRRSVAALRASPVEGRSLPEALAVVVDECSRAGVPTELAVTGDFRDLSPPARLALFRTAQEGLTNVRKHARATRAEVTLDYANAAVVRLAVRDDGVGSDAKRAGAGFGLLGVRERVQLLGGQVQVRTAPGQGFSLEVEVPG